MDFIQSLIYQHKPSPKSYECRSKVLVIFTNNPKSHGCQLHTIPAENRHSPTCQKLLSKGRVNWFSWCRLLPPNLIAMGDGNESEKQSLLGSTTASYTATETTGEALWKVGLYFPLFLCLWIITAKYQNINVYDKILW